MKAKIFITFFFFLFTFCASAQKKDVMLFILSGQSNAMGHGDGSKLPTEYKISNNDVLLYLQTAGKWQNMAALGPVRTEIGMKSKSFGTELTFAFEMKKKYPNKIIAVAKVAMRGGTSIVAWDKNYKRSDWITDLKEADNEDAATDKLYDKLISETKKCIDLLKTNPNVGTIVISGMIWMQYERDNRPISLVNKYEQRLIDLINNVRTDLKVSEMPFLALDAHRPSNQVAFRAVHKRVENKLKYVKVVNADNLTYNIDNVHFDTNGHIEYGKRMCNAYIVMTKPTFTKNDLNNENIYVTRSNEKTIIFHNIPEHSNISIYSIDGSYVYSDIVYNDQFYWY
jgi:hypothetical protein